MPNEEPETAPFVEMQQLGQLGPASVVVTATGANWPRSSAKSIASCTFSGVRDGRAYLSNATVGGQFALRACVTNFRTTRHDIDRTLRLVRELGNRLTLHRR